VSPRISVVMSVYNGGEHLQATMASLLSQSGCDLEVVVVEDGSTDGSGDVLARFAREDRRVRVLPQPNKGLTVALMRGCAEARGEYIARQDAADLSLPGRLAEQAALLDSDPGCAVVAGNVRFVAPNGEFLSRLEVPDRIDLPLDANALRPPPLAAAMFRRAAYERAGGFRSRFVVAQDIDMWLRLAEQGSCRGIPRDHYEARWLPEGISSRRRDAQLRHAELAVASALARRAGLSDAVLLAADPDGGLLNVAATAAERARLYYFIGSCLRKSDAAAARGYFRTAWREDPRHLRSLWRLLFG
jgi:glycosyltransferase involved in cell wall biosynthesis